MLDYIKTLSMGEHFLDRMVGEDGRTFRQGQGHEGHDRANMEVGAYACVCAVLIGTCFQLRHLPSRVNQGQGHRSTSCRLRLGGPLGRDTDIVGGESLS